jgi:predicted Zn-dependent protease
MAHSLLANLYARQRRDADAEAALKKAVEINPQAPGPYIGLANVYVVDNKPQRAIAVLHEGLRVNPREPMLSLALAESVRSGGRA